MSQRDKVVVAGYLVRCPLGGYAWQVLHYLIGLRDAGFDPYFYEDTCFFNDCFDPQSGQMHAAPDAGVAFVENLFAQYGLAGRWAFWDAHRGRHYGMKAADTLDLLWTARVVINLGGATRLPRRQRERKIFIDLDPGYTQLRASQGDRPLRGLLADQDLHFTFGENIGRPGSRIPTAGFEWRPTRQPIVTQLWTSEPPAGSTAYTTIGRWDESRRDMRFEGETYSWRKRVEWLKFLALPERVGERFQLAMDVDKIPGDVALLRQHGWEITDPLAQSRDAETYRRFICNSAGEFTVAKDLNIRLASGWFSDRSACYLAAGRPVLTQDTGFGQTLPVGRGLFAIRTLDDAIAALAAIRADPRGHQSAARAIAEKYFEATAVVGTLLASL
ncbi:MAG: hypothetical protein HY270_19865 [Deltaproteobacteria bacterium]|nr:hypothetical protein [Deltaproteobacteria bacterium]